MCARNLTKVRLICLSAKSVESGTISSASDSLVPKRMLRLWSLLV